MKRIAALLLLAACWLVTPAGAQPDRQMAALAKAKEKFETEISKADDALIGSLDKALTKAKSSGNKALAEKVAYERDLFVNQRIIPTTVPTAAYVKQRSQATAVLLSVYRPAIAALSKAKKDDEAVALESALSDLLKAARGYGLALPDLASRPPVIIESKATGLVLESRKDGRGELMLREKVGRRNALQCWFLDRDEKGYVITNAQTKESLYVTLAAVGDTTDYRVYTNPLEADKAVPDRSLFQLTELRDGVTLTSLYKGGAKGSVLAAAEKKLKGVTVHELLLTKKESSPSDKQIWIITEAK